jgi:hypothetical protein
MASMARRDRATRPPADLSTRTLPIDILPAGTAFFRIHRVEFDALHFGRSGLNRFDDPERRFGVCYVARSIEGAFAETCLRTVGAALVSRAFLAERGFTEITAKAALRLARMHGPGLARLGATAAVTSGPYVLAQPWSRALHAHPAAVDGIAYRSNHDNGEFCAALFERCASRLRVGPSVGLMSDPSRLAALLDRYGVGLA